jgi:hypothetical protein
LSEINGFNDLLNPNLETVSNSNILKLNKNMCRTNNSIYSVIRYDKNLLSHDLISSYGLCRSVIVNSANNVVGFSPPKSISAETFIKQYPETTSGVVAEEFIEGTMINVFFDQSIGITGGWEISTRNTVGATSSFYKYHGSKTFRQMFMEAAAECKLDINRLNPAMCYSFVLQHPENRIVVPFNKPQLYLIAVYQIEISNGNIMVKTRDIEECKYFFGQEGVLVKFPEVYELTTYSELIDKYASMNTPYSVLGVMIHNKLTGERAKIRNPVYEQVRNLRGNQPKLQYQYLCLRRKGEGFLEILS